MMSLSSGSMNTSGWPRGTTVLARFDYHSDSIADLSFSKDDVLTIVEQTADPNWYKAEDNHRKRGLIPANFVTTVNNWGHRHQHPPHHHHHHHPHGLQNGQNAVEKTPQMKGRTLNEMVWFHGKITRDRAEQLLTSHITGVFLVRESTNFPGDYTLCVVSGSKVEHYRIIYKNEKFTIDEEEFFKDLLELIKHYQNDADGLCAQLTKALPRQTEADTKEFLQAGWSIDPSSLQLIKPIGKGEFGEVLLGKLNDQQVAVKSLNKESKESHLFFEEAGIMTSFQHPNLVKLIGFVFGESYYIITEYMALGNLVDYLRTRGRNVITKKDQINFACNTCSGMAYLESKGIVHRDLAARNVLIDEKHVAKVSDFGLARQKFNDSEGGKFPIKWTAPEALRKSQFSSKSDMWSFGILLWELYSFGRVPYPRIPLTDVVRHVESGYRMESPEGCPSPVYEIMLLSWKLDTDQRPTFHEVSVKLDNINEQTV